MQYVRIGLSVVILLVVAAAAAWFYFIHVPAVTVPALAGDYSSSEIATEQGARSFSWYLPPDLPQGAPLLLVLHGSMGSSAQVRESAAYEFDVLADRYGFVVAYPDGYQKHWNDCRKTADYAANTQNIDDIAFLRDLLGWFAREYGIDPRRVYVTGHSNGGHMAYRLALETPELIAAIAPISANLPVDSSLDCQKSGKPVSVAILNGTEDPINPYDGGLVELFGNTSRGTVLSANDTAQYWAQLAGIQLEPEVINYPETDGDLATQVELKQWRLNPAMQVRLYTLTGSGHVIPSKTARAPRIAGPSAADISGPQEIVSFFFAIDAARAATQTK